MITGTLEIRTDRPLAAEEITRLENSHREQRLNFQGRPSQNVARFRFAVPDEAARHGLQENIQIVLNDAGAEVEDFTFQGVP